MKNTACLDWEALKGHCAEDESLMRELIDIFLSEGPQMLAEVRKCWKAADAAALHQAAHRLKGALLSLAAGPAAQHAHSMEQVGQAGALEGGAEAMAGLEAEMTSLHEALQAWLKQPST